VTGGKKNQRRKERGKQGLVDLTKINSVLPYHLSPTRWINNQEKKAVGINHKECGIVHVGSTKDANFLLKKRLSGRELIKKLAGRAFLERKSRGRTIRGG